MLGREPRDAWEAAQRALLDGDAARAPPAADVDGGGGGTVSRRRGAPRAVPSAPQSARRCALSPVEPGSSVAETQPPIPAAFAAMSIRPRPVDVAPYKAPPTRLPSAVLDAKCREVGLNPEDRAGRARAAKLARADDSDDGADPEWRPVAGEDSEGSDGDHDDDNDDDATGHESPFDTASIADTVRDLRESLLANVREGRRRYSRRLPSLPRLARRAGSSQATAMPSAGTFRRSMP